MTIAGAAHNATSPAMHHARHRLKLANSAHRQAVAKGDDEDIEERAAAAREAEGRVNDQSRREHRLSRGGRAERQERNRQLWAAENAKTTAPGTEEKP